MEDKFLDPRLIADNINKAALVSIRDGKLLVGRSYNKDAFYLPGGKVDAGETVEEALVREIREELASGTAQESVRSYGTFTSQAHGKKAGKNVTMHCFTAILDGEPAPSEEVEELAWVGADEAGRVSSASQLVLEDLARKSLVTDSEKPNRAVLFDLDDTLFFTREAKWNQHRAVALKNWGIELTDDALRTHWGMPFEPMIALLYEGNGTDAERVAAYNEFSQDFPKIPIPGALETVTALLDRGVAVGIVSSAVTEKITEELTKNNFPVERFFTVQGADRSDFHKPDGRVFEDALKILRACGKIDITYVGDALMDEAAARDAGFKFFGLTTGLFSEEDFPAGTKILGSITELPDYFA